MKTDSHFTGGEKHGILICNLVLLSAVPAGRGSREAPIWEKLTENEVDKHMAQPQATKSQKKLYISLLVFVLLVVLTFYLLLRGQELGSLLDIVRHVDVVYLLAGALLVCTYLLCQGRAFQIILRSLQHRVGIWEATFYTCVDFYVSSITPSATGGQPAVMYYMSKNGIHVSKSGIVVLLNTVEYKVVLLLLSLGAVIYDRAYIGSSDWMMKLLILIGFAANILMVALCILAMFSNRLIYRLGHFGISLLAKCRLLKNKEKKLEGLRQSLDDYHEGALHIKNHPSVVLRSLLANFVQRIALFSVGYCVYRSMGFSALSYFDLLVIQILCSIAIDSLPMPGGVGASELLLLRLYETVYPSHLVMPAMLLSRGLQYYFCLLTSAVGTGAGHLRLLYRAKHAEEASL